MFLQIKKLFFTYCSLISFLFFLFPSQLLGDTETVRLQLRWKHQFQFAGYYAAIDQGYYTEAGLDVSIIEGGPGIDTVEQVIQGNAEYGVTNSELLLHFTQGKPLVVLAAIFQHSPLVFVSRSDTKISTPQDFTNKIIKLGTKSRAIELVAMLHNEGLDMNKIIFLDELAQYPDYFDPNIDALAAYSTNQPYFYEQKGIQYSIIKPSSYGVDFYGDCLFSSAKEAKENHERTQRFIEASLRGWKFALEHPDKIINLIKNQYSTTKTIDHLAYEARESKKLIMPNLIEVGHINPGRWKHIADTFAQYNMIPEDYNLDGFLFTDYREGFPSWLFKLILAFFVTTLFFSIISFILFLFNRRLKKEVSVRKNTENALTLSEQKLQSYAKQTEQFSLSAAAIQAIQAIQDEKKWFDEICNAIITYSDYSRVLISVFNDEPPYREIKGSGGLSEDILTKVSSIDFSKNWFDDVFKLGIKIGKNSYYIPHTMKYILNQEAVILGQNDVQVDFNKGSWHPEDNLFVRMNDRNGDFLGVISVDSSKSRSKPTDDLVRPLEIYASMISQLLIFNREHALRIDLEQKLEKTSKLEALGYLTGGIAHDFNNLLSIIKCNTELASLTTDKKDTAFNHLVRISDACKRAELIVGQLLTFSLKDEKEFTVQPVKVLLLETIKEIKDKLPQNIQLTENISLENEKIHADSELIKKAILNICINSIQAMKKAASADLFIDSKPIEISSILHCINTDLAPGKYIKIAIRDTGSGIPVKDVENIFDPNYTTKEFDKGAGIGLAIVRGIIESHRGGLDVLSIPPEGSTFTLYIPCCHNNTLP